jgi:hypothetical protein
MFARLETWWPDAACMYWYLVLWFYLLGFAVAGRRFQCGREWQGREDGTR